MTGVQFPDGFRIEPLRRDHPRRAFRSGQAEVDDWLATKALQNQEKHLSVTRVLLDEPGSLVGYHTRLMMDSGVVGLILVLRSKSGELNRQDAKSRQEDAEKKKRLKTRVECSL